MRGRVTQDISRALGISKGLLRKDLGYIQARVCSVVLHQPKALSACKGPPLRHPIMQAAMHRLVGHRALAISTALQQCAGSTVPCQRKQSECRG